MQCDKKDTTAIDVLSSNAATQQQQQNNKNGKNNNNNSAKNKKIAKGKSDAVDEEVGEVDV